MEQELYQEPTYDYVAGEEKIDDDVIAVATARAVLGTEGVCRLVGGIGDSISKTLLRKEALSKGLKIDQKEKGIEIDVFIYVYYGARIPDIVFNIQRNVKSKIQELTDRKVLAVNIHVQGVKERT